MKKPIFVIALVLVLSFALTFSGLNIARVEAKTISVPDDYATIQEAIDAASDGDTIVVKSGVYHEELDVSKSLSLVGEDRDTTMIYGGISITRDRVDISGFTIGSTDPGIGLTTAAIYSYSNNYCNISRNKLVDFTYGISFSDSSYNTVEGNIIERNYYGISMIVSHNNTISENDITNNNQGILLNDAHQNSIIENNVTNSESGILLRFSNNNAFSLNNFIGNTNHVSDSHYSQGAGGIWLSVNDWDNGVMGNYWSNYTGVDSNGDGIGDTPYIMDEYNQDNFPLARAHNIISGTSEPDNQPTQTDESFPTIWIIVAIIIIAAVGVASLLYFTKLRKTTETPGESANLHR